jgi:hypothetical protein
MVKTGRGHRVRIGLAVVSIATVIGGLVLHGEYQRYINIKRSRYQKEMLLSPVVRLISEYDTPYGKKRIRGSGVIVYSEPSWDGYRYDTYILTANHVVETPIYSGKRLGRPGSIQHEYYDMTPVGIKRLVTYVEYFDVNIKTTLKAPAYVVAYSPNNIFDIDKDGNMSLKREDWRGKTGGEDLALLRLETTEPFCAVKLLSPERIGKLKVLDKVRLVGCALADRPVSTSGEITRLEKGYTQVNAPIVFGNSGGACFLEETNELIGISNAMRVTNVPMGPRVPVAHMALVRPISRIYDWLKSEEYAFIYDKTVPDTVRYETIQRDKYMRHFALKREQEKNIEVLEKKIKKLETDNKFLKEKIDGLTSKCDTCDLPQLPEHIESLIGPQLPECEPKCDEN